ncbi:MAG: type II toxin-antitoxin system VapC family toxin [Actinomycetota bacterium]|nr:type II toxin-antitoxin system VapC family toxin [Actinomycetota bacterium]
MIYLHSSALMKLIRAETETVPLQAWLRSRGEVAVVTSELSRVEVLRAARRASDAALVGPRTVMGGVDFVPLDQGVRDLACEIGEPLLRTLEALHLASAVLVRDELTAFVAYDHRLTHAARSAGLPVAIPS